MKASSSSSNKTFVLCASVLLLTGCGSTGAPGAAKRLSPEAAAEAAVQLATAEQYQGALALMQQQKFLEAELALLKFVLAYPDYSGPYVNLGILYARSGRADKAEEAFRDAIARNPGNAAAHNQLGILYREAGRFEEADRAYQEALAAAPDYASAHFNRAVLYDLYLQQPTIALSHYERYQALSGNADGQVAKWIAELKIRIEAEERAAQVGSR